MTPSRFVRLLRLRGPALDRWPDAERNAARRVVATSRRARARYLEALDTQAGLDDPIDPAIAARLLSRLHGRTACRDRTAGFGWLRRAFDASFGQPAVGWGAMTACAVLGAWLGWQNAAAPTAPAVVLASLQMTVLDAGPSDIAQ